MQRLPPLQPPSWSEASAPALQWAPQSRAQVAGKGVSMKTSRDCIPDGGLLKSHPSHLRAPAQTRPLTNSLWAPGQGSSTKGTRNTWKVIELTSFGVRAGGARVRIALSKDRNAGRCHCSFVECPSHPAGKHR